MTVTLVAGTDRALLLFVGYGNPSGGGGPSNSTMFPTFGGANMSQLTIAPNSTTNALEAVAYGYQISDGSTGDYAVIMQKSGTNDLMLGVGLLFSGVSLGASNVSSTRSFGTNALGGTNNPLVPVDAANDMVVSMFVNGSGTTVSQTRLGEGTPVVSELTVGGTASGQYHPRVSVVTQQGDSSVSLQWSLSASERWRMLNIMLSHSTTDPTPAGVNVESYQTYGIQQTNSRSTTTFTLGSGTTRVLIVFGAYANPASGVVNGPTTAPTFAGVSIPVFARPLTGGTSLMPIIYAMNISDGSTGAYPLVCVKDAANDLFEGAGFILSNALLSGLSYQFAQSLSSGPAGLAQPMVPTNGTLDYVFGFFAGASGSTMTYTKLGEGTDVVSSMTPGGGSTGIYIPSVSIVTSKGDSSVSLLWQISDGVTDAQRWRLFGLSVPVANDGSVFGPGAPYFIHRRLHSFDW